MIGEASASPLAPIQWLPWMDAALRLYHQNKNIPAIARAVGQEQSTVSYVMKTSEWLTRSNDMQCRLNALYEQRMQELWDLSPEAIAVMRRIVQEHDELHGSEANPVSRQRIKGYAASRKEAKEVAKDLLDRIGLKAPEKVEVTSESHHTETTETKLTYEQRLTLIREQKAAGLPVDEDLLDLPIQGTDG